MKTQTIGLLLASCGIFAVPLAARAQQQDQSLAEKARQIREKEKTAPKASVVWTNQNLPTDAALSIVGQISSSTQSNERQASGAAGAQAAQNDTVTDASGLEAELTELKSQMKDAKKDLKSAQKDLDLAQRLQKLDSDQHYSTPDYKNDQAGQAKLDADQKQVTTKQADVDAKQKKVDDLQKKIDDLNAKLKEVKAKPDTSQS